MHFSEKWLVRMTLISTSLDLFKVQWELFAYNPAVLIRKALIITLEALKHIYIGTALKDTFYF